MAREKLGSRLGFILLSAGCAIGIGNVWKFPWMVGQNGGGAFVLIYLFFLLVMGIPVMTMEFALGRASQKSMTRLYQTLTPDKPAWKAHGYLSMVGNVILMMFYTCVSGWMLKYFVDMARGSFTGLDTNGVAAHFGNMLSDPTSLIIYALIVTILGFVVCGIGVQNGLERVTKIMMLALLVIMVVLAINGFTLDGAKEGLKFYLVPNFENMKAAGIGNVVVAAMNQAFFTLSLGIGSMAIFGSYLNRDRALMGEAVNVAVLDTFVAITSGLIIFPACYTYHVAVDNGPSLIFITLPNVFNNLPLGRVWGTLFFLFMTFAAFSTVLAVFENIIACTMDITGWSRKKTCVIDGVAMAVLSLPCILGFNVLAGFTPFGAGSNVLDLEDFIVSNILLPLGSLCFVIYCTNRFGFGWDKFVEEANQGKGFKVKGWMRLYMKYILPIIVIALFVVGVIPKIQYFIGLIGA
ncbi:MAG: sodium-dependent transporter [Clostridia bacterium]|nr:sodium-dependent transporter [Clostridia bacterium]